MRRAPSRPPSLRPPARLGVLARVVAGDVARVRVHEEARLDRVDLAAARERRHEQVARADGHGRAPLAHDRVNGRCDYFFVGEGAPRS